MSSFRISLLSLEKGVLFSKSLTPKPLDTNFTPLRNLYQDAAFRKIFFKPFGGKIGGKRMELLLRSITTVTVETQTLNFLCSEV